MAARRCCRGATAGPARESGCRWPAGTWGSPLVTQRKATPGCPPRSSTAARRKRRSPGSGHWQPRLRGCRRPLLRKTASGRPALPGRATQGGPASCGPSPAARPPRESSRTQRASSRAQGSGRRTTHKVGSGVPAAAGWGSARNRLLSARDCPGAAVACNGPSAKPRRPAPSCFPSLVAWLVPPRASRAAWVLPLASLANPAGPGPGRQRPGR
mmetsp:Transcript_6788/g.18753  ORF Transcript_6788/g.18753 Transcript_6788/m.18753 type:complete len:213 (+) Transcript_6788:280-918(+)